MEITKHLEKMSNISLSTRDKQHKINVSEVYHIWDHLVQRYHVVYITEIFHTLAKDKDLKIVFALGTKVLDKNIKILEEKIAEYAIPLPLQPPKVTQNRESLENVTDRHMYRKVLRGIQSFLPTHTMAYVHSTTPVIKDIFMSFLIDEVKLYDKFMEYGKFKGYILEPPIYRL